MDEDDEEEILVEERDEVEFLPISNPNEEAPTKRKGFFLNPNPKTLALDPRSSLLGTKLSPLTPSRRLEFSSGAGRARRGSGRAGSRSSAPNTAICGEKLASLTRFRRLRAEFAGILPPFSGSRPSGARRPVASSSPGGRQP
uniref:Uncharacterized protein n=1 Tax=Ananas comosus var. bracteatus TaxID=296719 RepID=A0A6V7PF34_ANACO|nr:unnamed protein product [Ananas comosus var. bracteatus]